jgi:hypothetical protein
MWIVLFCCGYNYIMCTNSFLPKYPHPPKLLDTILDIFKANQFYLVESFLAFLYNDLLL